VSTVLLAKSRKIIVTESSGMSQPPPVAWFIGLMLELEGTCFVCSTAAGTEQLGEDVGEWRAKGKIVTIGELSRCRMYYYGASLF
jgi:hypothetical protein